MFPVVMNDVAKTLDDFGVVDFDGEFAAGIETAGREIDRADDRAGMVGEEQLAVEFEVFKLVNLDADIVHDAETADTFGELFLL